LCNSELPYKKKRSQIPKFLDSQTKRAFLFCFQFSGFRLCLTPGAMAFLSISMFFCTHVLCLVLLFSNFLYIASIPTFSSASLAINGNSTLTPFDFTVTFRTGNTKIHSSNPTVVFLPRFTKNLNKDANFSAGNVSFTQLLISPSLLFEAEFIEASTGLENYSVLPYISSMLLIRARNNYTIVENSTVSIKVFKENGIGAICGFPSSVYLNATRSLTKMEKNFEISSIDYGITHWNESVTTTNYTWSVFDTLLSAISTTKNVTFYRNTTIFLDNSRVLDYWPGIGKGCSLQGQCRGKGICNFCYETCECFEGYGSAEDLIGTGSSMNSDCSSSNTPLSVVNVIFFFLHTSFIFFSLGVCPTGKAIADIATDVLVAHGRAECSNRGNCNRLTGECECFHPFTGSACEKSTKEIVLVSFSFTSRFIISLIL
jgi:hypothetical protein